MRSLRVYKGGLTGIVLFALACPHAPADDCMPPGGRGTYIGVFGGGGGSTIGSVTQVGTALFPETSGGPLNVNATANPGSRGVGLVGLQIGHEWSGANDGCGWSLLPACEFEGFYLGGTQRADVSDPNNRLNGHVFDVTLPMDNAVFLTNVVLSFKSPFGGLKPYVGAGIGAACVNINGADSLQVIPPEPGVNHFNSNPDSSAWGFAAQAKVGARFALSDHVYVFTEYRFLYVGSTTQTFGSTQYPTHVPTTPWTVHLGDTYNHLGVGGIGFNF